MDLKLEQMLKLENKDIINVLNMFAQLSRDKENIEKIPTELLKTKIQCLM